MSLKETLKSKTSQGFFSPQCLTWTLHHSPLLSIDLFIKNVYTYISGAATYKIVHDPLYGCVMGDYDAEPNSERLTVTETRFFNCVLLERTVTFLVSFLQW